MWKQLIVPTLVVSGLWVLVSPATTYSLYWLDRSYQAALQRHLNSVGAANQVREDVWRIMSYIDSPGLARVLPESTAHVEKGLRELRQIADSPPERQLVQRMGTEWQEYVEIVRAIHDGASNGERFSRSRKLRAAAETLAGTVHELRDLHQELWVAAVQHREHWMEVILTLRSVLVVIGPILGICLGWWMGLRLHQSISQINIILKDATVEWEENLAELRVQSREDLSQLRDRVEKVVERMRQVSTELATSRREALRNERLATVGELAAGIAHELRNPLTSIKLLLQHAAQQSDSRLREEESRVVLEEISRMERAIQGLLDFSRPPSAQRRRHDVRETLGRALNLVQGRAKQQGVQIEPRLGSVPLIVDGDPEQLQQVCVNLLINGLEAMVDGGTFEIQAHTDDRRGRVVLGFHDQGPGIPKHLLAEVFEPFVSTKACGTGLGLAISRRIVCQHGGRLIADNHPGGGAILTLELPLARDADRELDSVSRGVPAVV